MLFLSKETQANMEMAQGANQEERTKELVEEITEEQFLKELYLFMKKRDTPIERIPHLGFKQIDLFVMFKTVRDLGGYHQVTAQQLWKQVYNTLGGNPRSTSAATCTRRHYEKLLLPYECHVKGILMNNLPQHQSKAFHFPSLRKDDDEDGQIPAKRRMMSLPLQQGPFNHPPDPHGNVFPLPIHYPHCYLQSPAVLPPYVPTHPPVFPNPPLAPKPQFAVPHQTFTTSTDVEKGPLEYLRVLADKYKHITGLTEPLNLSVKASSQETNKNPASSFSPLLSTRNPRFLNKPSPLYTPQHPQVAKSDETQDHEAAVESKPYLYPEEEKDAYIVSVKSAPSSPTRDCGPALRTEEDTTAMAQKSSSPQTDFTTWPKDERDGSPEIRRLNLSHLLPSLPQDNGGKMEIEIPLSVLHKWLRLCQAESSTIRRGNMQSLEEENMRQRNFSDTDVLFNNMQSHINPQHQSPAAEDLRLRQTTATIQTSNNHLSASQNHFTSYKPMPPGIVKNASSSDVCSVEHQDIMKSYNSKPGYWGAYDIGTQGFKIAPPPLTAHQNFAITKPYNEDTLKGGKERSEVGPSAILMVDSSPGSVLHLTTEEVMKLKKIISSSS